MWYHERIGGERCPIVDTWWQTETGAIVISPLPGDHRHQARERNAAAARVLRRPSGRRGTSGRGRGRVPRAHEAVAVDAPDDLGRRSALRGDVLLQVAGPSGPVLRGRRRASGTTDGDFWILGRVDDVLNVAGHRIGTMEVESALVEHPAVAEAAVVGRSHEMKGQAIVAFVTLREGQQPHPSSTRSCVASWSRRSARSPARTMCCLRPICRRLARARSCAGCCATFAEGRALGDTTTLADPNVVAGLKEQYEAREA